MTIRYLALAVDKWIAAGNYYEAQRPSLAGRFDDEVRAGIRQIQGTNVRRYRNSRIRSFIESSRIELL